MKKMMQDHGHEGFVKTVSAFMEKRKKKIVENNIFPPNKYHTKEVVSKPTTASINPGTNYYEIYSGGE